MNTNPNAVRILCYGDSNTKGTVPGSQGTGRYDSNIRWTGVLQNLLGNDYEIIEEGLGGRTTIIDDDKRYGRNGKTFLPIALESHLPLDIVILALGTNDLKERYGKSIDQVIEGIEELLKIVREIAFNSNNKSSRVILVSPAYIDESAPGVISNYKGAGLLSQELGPRYRVLADQYTVECVDLSVVVHSSKKDGLHFDPDGHEKVARALYDLIKMI